MARIALPWEMHGHDITPILKNPEVQWEHPVLMENTKYYYGKDTELEDRPGWAGVRDLPPVTVPVVKLLFAAPLGQPLHFVEA